MVTIQKPMVPKKFVLTVLLAAALFVSGHVLWTTFVNPSPTSISDGSVTAEQNLALPALNPTIVAASINKDGIPEKIGKLALTNSTLGKDALAEFETLH